MIRIRCSGQIEIIEFSQDRRQGFIRPINPILFKDLSGVPANCVMYYWTEKTAPFVVFPADIFAVNYANDEGCFHMEGGWDDGKVVWRTWG